MKIDPIAAQSAPKAALRTKAEALEAAFLAEMLRHSGLGEQESRFGGGIGETQVTSFLREAQAKAMVNAGGIGLAELLLRSMVKQGGDRG
jgi:Rod binding domain-containing protein